LAASLLPSPSSHWELAYLPDAPSSFASSLSPPLLWFFLFPTAHFPCLFHFLAQPFSLCCCACLAFLHRATILYRVFIWVRLGFRSVLSKLYLPSSVLSTLMRTPPSCSPGPSMSIPHFALFLLHPQSKAY
jgi:hypothetical protein